MVTQKRSLLNDPARRRAKAQDFRTSLGRVMIPPHGGLKAGSAVSFFSSDEACVFGGVQGGCVPPGDGRGLLDCGGGEIGGSGSAGNSADDERQLINIFNKIINTRSGRLVK